MGLGREAAREHFIERSMIPIMRSACVRDTQGNAGPSGLFLPSQVLLPMGRGWGRMLGHTVAGEQCCGCGVDPRCRSNLLVDRCFQAK